MSERAYASTHLMQPCVTGWTLRVGVFRAVNVRKADSFGKSDPYAVVYVNGIKRRRSKCIKKTLNPYWEEVLECHLDKDNLGAATIMATSFQVALFDMDVVGTHDFLGAVQLEGDDFIQFCAHPLKHKPPWDVGSATASDRMREFDLSNMAPHPETAGVRGRLAFWAEIRPDADSERKLAAIKIQAIHRGKQDRDGARRAASARRIQKIARGNQGRRHFERTEFAYLAFTQACAHLKRWISWNDLDLEEVFAELDVDASGLVSADEATRFFGTHPSLDLSEPEVEAILFHLDPNHDGQITHQDFVQMVADSDEVSAAIKENWAKHLKSKAVMMRVKDMGVAWETAAKNKRDGVAGAGTVGAELQATRRRRNSRWAAEFDLLKATAAKKEAAHRARMADSSKRKETLHSRWRTESKRRIEDYQRRRQKMQQRLLAQQSEWLREDEDSVYDGGGGNGADDTAARRRQRRQQLSGAAGVAGPPPFGPSEGTGGTGGLSPNRLRRQNKPRPLTPTEVMKRYNYWERMKDRKTKRIFYCNCNTREVVWTLPPGGVVWPPLPPVEVQEEPRISPFARFDPVPPGEGGASFAPGGGGGEAGFDGRGATSMGGQLPPVVSPSSPPAIGSASSSAAGAAAAPRAFGDWDRYGAAATSPTSPASPASSPTSRVELDQLAESMESLGSLNVFDFAAGERQPRRYFGDDGDDRSGVMAANAYAPEPRGFEASADDY